MYGAQALVKTLAACGVRACFANPGTSEMHLVTALDQEPAIRSVLCLFEGVATGAADGFARVSGGPAMTLLHLGPGFLNGGANLHNARRGFAPTINVVGEHATYHRRFDAPLTSDIEGLIAPLSAWTGVAETAAQCGPLAAQAFAASFGPPGGNAFLILPADAAWSEGGAIAAPVAAPGLKTPDAGVIETAARAIAAAKRPALLVNGAALSEPGLSALARLAAAGVNVQAATFAAKQRRGAGLYGPPRLPYFGEMALAALEGVDLLMVAGCNHPVAFFAYPGKPSELTPDGAGRLSLGGAETDSAAIAAMLADAIGAPAAPPSRRHRSLPIRAARLIRPRLAQAWCVTCRKARLSAMMR
jgi:acetolactate synthase I/II/III large subunit